MHPEVPTPFLKIPEMEWVCANEFCFAIFDSYPVSPGHVLVITRRVVPTFFECTAAEQGAIISLVGKVKALLDHNPDPTETEVRYWLAGNLCRCTGYDKIVRAVMDTAAEMRGA